MLNEKLASLLIEFALEGSEEVREKAKAVQKEMTATAEAAKFAGGAFQDRLAAASKILTQSLSGGLKPEVARVTTEMIRQIAAVKGVTEEQARQLVKTELARTRLRELTEQTAKYGMAVVENVQRKASTAFLIATGTVVGLATAGVRASYLSDVFGISMDRLARTVGGLVAPEVQKIIGLIDQFTSWIHQLDPAQKELVATWIEMAAVGTALARVFGGWVGIIGALAVGSGQGSETMARFGEVGQHLMATLEKLQPVIEAVAEVVADTLNVALDVLNVLIDTGIARWIAVGAAAYAFAQGAAFVVSAISTITAAVKALTAAKILSLAYEGPTGWAKLAAGAAIGAAAIAGAGVAINAFGKHTDASTRKHKALREELAKKSSGMEGLEATYNRIANSSVNVGAALGGTTATGGGMGAAAAGLTGPAGGTDAVKGAVDGQGKAEQDKIDLLGQIAETLRRVERNTAGFIRPIGK